MGLNPKLVNDIALLKEHVDDANIAEIVEIIIENLDFIIEKYKEFDERSFKN